MTEHLQYFTELTKQDRRGFLKGSSALLLGMAGASISLDRAGAFSWAASDGADLVVTNARIWTGDAARPSAQAFAVKDGLFVAVGSNEEAKQWVTPKTKVEDAGGLYIVPGMMDCHNHGSGVRLLNQALVGNPYTIEFFTVDQMVDILKKAAEKVPEGHWVIGGFFDDTKLKDNQQLRKEDLDRVSTKLPVRVNHRGGHTSWFNSKAFELAGITEDTPDPKFGAFVRDGDGKLTGQVAEKARDAFDQIAEVVPLPENAAVEGLAFISKKFAEFGLTTVHTTGTNVDALREVRRKGELKHRANVEFRYADLDPVIEAGLTTGAGDRWIRLGAVGEMTVDGSFSERTLRSIEPYDSKNPPYGIFTMSQEQANDAVEKCMRNGIQVNLHVNGDAAIDRGLNAIERSLQQIKTPRNSHFSDFRPKLTHCTMMDKNYLFLDRIKKVNAIPQLFTSYIYYNAEKWHIYGEEVMSRSMAFKSLLDFGIPAVQGTDFFPGPFDPIMALQGMVTRKGWNDETWGANQAISVDQGLTVLTYNGAYSSHEEDVKGSISVGKLADYVYLSDDPHENPQKIIDIKVVRTVVGGETMFEA